MENSNYTDTVWVQESKHICGRFYIDDNTMLQIETIVKKIERKLAKIGTVYPTEPALVLCSDGYEIQGQTMKWGYENPKDNTRIINARSETVLWGLPIRLYGSIIDIG